MKKYIFYIILYMFYIHCVIGSPVITINKKQYMLSDIYKEFGYKDWNSATAEQKKELLDGFITRRLAVIESKDLGFLNSPDIANTLYNREQIALVNITYEELVAKPLIPQDIMEKTKKYILEERLLSHILIGHQLSKTDTPSKKTIDEAFLLAQKISNELVAGASFADYAVKYSEDPTVFQNEGRLDWIPWGRTILEFQDAAFRLKKGAYSRPIKTDFGFHVIFCEAIRPSEYSEYSDNDLDEIIYTIARGYIANQLPLAATQYDSLQLIRHQTQYNNTTLEKILERILQQEEKKKISGQYKLDLIDLFENMDDVGVVVVFDQKGYGIKWFSERLKMIPRSRHPGIVNLESLKTAFNMMVLQFFAIQAAVENKITELPLYKKQVEGLHQQHLYSQYLKWLVNNASLPDSIEIKQYYEENKENKYLQGEKASIREIKVLTQTLADSLYLEIQYGADFIGIAEKHSKTNPGNGGLMQPFSRGQYNQMGEAAFSLPLGSVSQVIQNLDRTFSIVRLEKLLDPEYIPYEKVYTRIQSLLTREHQRRAKEDGLKQLRKKYNVIINTGFYSD